MLFLALFMMPIYYGSKVRSVPEFLKLRYGEATRAFNAVSFATLMVLVSGISLYAMAIVLRALLGWSFTQSVTVAAAVVLVYVSLGGLTATIYNEVLQFALIVAGFAPLAWYCLREIWWVAGAGRRAAVPAGAHLARHARVQPVWRGHGRRRDSAGPGIRAEFRVLVHGFPADSARAGRPEHQCSGTDSTGRRRGQAVLSGDRGFAGLAAIALFPRELASRYDLALPALMARYYSHGLLGLGVTAMLASFMSGMAGNITAFNTVWTYDLYESYIAPGAPWTGITSR